MAMFEPFFGFKKSPFAPTPDSKQLFESGAWNQLKARLQFLTDHRGAGLLTGEPGSGKSTAARTWLAGLNPNLYKIIYLHWSSGSALDLLRQLARDLDLEPSHFKGDLVDQIAEAIVRLNKTKKQHPIVVFDEAQLLSHPALEQIPLLLNFDMDSSTYLTLLLIGQPLLRRTLSLQHHEALRQRIAVHYHLEGLSRSELDDYIAHQLKAAGCSQPVFDDTARQALYQATKGIPRKVNKLALTALRLAASRKVSIVDEAVLMDAAAEALL
jgi:general secretion pathway protein A